MNVIQSSEDVNHLLCWVNSETSYLGLPTQHYTLQSILRSGDLATILLTIDDCYFTSLPTASDSMDDIFAAIEEFINKECGKRIKLALKNKVLKNFQIETIVSLTLYTCMHSKKKNEFIQRIIGLPEEVQTSLMETIQDIGGDIEGILEIKEILLRVEQLEMEAENLKQQLTVFGAREKKHILAISELEQDLSRSQKDLKTFNNEKQVVIDTLKLTNFDQYLLSFQKIQEENTMLSKYAQTLEQKNEEGDIIQNQMKKCIKNQLGVISDLNDEITYMKQKYNALKLEKINTFGSQETLDASRSFGNDLLNYSKQNLELSQIEKKKNKNRPSMFSELVEWLDEGPSNKENLTVGEEDLKSEIAQLRRCNNELMQKLDGVYQTVQSLTTESSEMREKNRNLKRENKFYKKQIEDLKKLHSRFERRYFAQGTV